ncbi:MAG: BON domain-containing protein [Pirellulaceae bacterium]|nr:BON domain-containing protein [Pirellulaceae bacterium]
MNVRQTGRRSLETIGMKARRRLAKSTHVSIRKVTCRYHEGVLLLHGRVSSYYAKQLAQEVVRDLDGVEEIDNRIEVARGKPV